MLYKKFFKRVIDFLLALVALSILSPLLVVCMIILLCTGEHEVFYFQQRIGRGGRPFRIWKFATMLKNSPDIGTGTITTRNDPRVLPFGAFLRKSKINELPQIINVLSGSMSVTGPRPLVEKHFDIYSDTTKERIGALTPGITGVGSIVFRDEERLLSAGGDPREIYRNVVAPYKGALEEWYADNVSFCTDIKIIILTALALLRPESDLHYRWFKNLPAKPENLC